MTVTFDPYHRWLGIAPDEQPPHHYRLLGLKLFEADADVIESAADKQMAHVRSFQSGPRADDAQRLLNEISAARIVLLSAEKKAGYDAQLQAKIDHLKKKRRQEQPLAVAQPLVATGEPPVPTATPPQPIIHTGARSSKTGVPKTVIHAAIAGGLALLLIGGAIALALRPWESPPEVADASTTGTRDNANANDNASINPPVSTTVVSPPPPPPPNTSNNPGEDQPEDPPPIDPAPIAPVDDPPPPVGPKREPVPDIASRDAARQKIAGIFPLDDADTPQAKAALAAQLLKVARETKDDAVARFVLLNLAREQAADAAKLRLALEAVDLLEAGYDFDTSSVRLATLGQAVKAPLPPAEKREVIVVGIEMMDAMIARDQYEAADKLADPLVDLARRVKEPPLLQALAERRKRAGELQVAYRRAKSAIETLQDDPDNAEANLAAGRFYLLAKGNWSLAMPLLAKGSDEQLADAAQAEIQRPSTTEQEEKLADAWWTIAENESDGAAQQLQQARAMAWYKRAESSLTGLAKAKAQSRLKQLADAGIRPANLAADLGFFSRPPTGLGTYPVDPVTDGLVAHWTFDDGQGEIARDAAGGNHGAIKGATWTKGIRGGALSFDGQDDIVDMGNPDALNFEGKISLAAWVRQASLPSETTGTVYNHKGYATILTHKPAGSVTRAVIFRVARRSTGVVYETGPYVANQPVRYATSPLPGSDVGAWVHLAAIYDDGEWRLFRNSERAATSEATSGAMTLTGDWTIGADAGRGQPFHGDIDDVRIYNRALSVDEVKALWQWGGGAAAGEDNGGDLGIFSRDPAEFGGERPPELPKLPDGPAPDLPPNLPDAQPPPVSDAAKILVLYRWGRDNYVDGRRSSETLVFLFNADGACKGVGRSGFVSGINTWKMEGNTLVFGGRRMEFADGKFRTPGTTGEQWTLTPLGPR